jgi:predicted transcriptional regulator
MSSSDDDLETVRLVARIVGSYVAKNRLLHQDLPGFIETVHWTVIGLRMNGAAAVPAETPKPAIPIKRSITDEFIVCLEDGMRFKSLKRHLKSAYGLAPEQYRLKWGLPHDYPMVAPNYAAHRSRLAKQIGLGRKRRGA